MDHRRFDSLSRALASPRSRRGFLGAAAALGAGLAAGRSADAQPVTQATCGNKTCRNNPARCTDGCVCCVYSNGNSRCRPPGTCAPGTVLCPPGQVVGPSGVCVAPTTTTTTTPNPQGTCPTGADICAGGLATACSGDDTCYCATNAAGATVCVGIFLGGYCGQCASDAECGAGAVCVRDTGGGCACATGEGFCTPLCSPAA